MSRALAPLAVAQLGMWRACALQWPLYQEKNSHHVRCAQCAQSIIRVADSSNNTYDYTHDQRIALIVAHIRQAHAEVESEVYGENSRNT